MAFGYIDEKLATKSNYNIQEVAEILDIKNFGRNKLFKWLREHGYFDQYNRPMTIFIENGLFLCKDNIYKTPLVTSEGVEFLKKKLILN